MRGASVKGLLFTTEYLICPVVWGIGNDPRFHMEPDNTNGFFIWGRSDHMETYRFSGIVLFIAGLIISIVLCSQALAYDNVFSRATLSGIDKFFVFVDSIDSEIERDGLTADIIKKDVELKLRLARINVISEDVGGLQKGKPYLSVGLIAIKSRTDGIPVYIYVATIEFIQRVFLERNQSIRESAPTWSRTIIGEASQIDNIRDTIKNLTDGFLNAYLSVNPK
jgi:hypothetical protein